VIWYVAEKVEGEWMIKGLDDGFKRRTNAYVSKRPMGSRAGGVVDEAVNNPFGRLDGGLGRLGFGRWGSGARVS
jgi:hypothetical protein